MQRKPTFLYKIVPFRSVCSISREVVNVHAPRPQGYLPRSLFESSAFWVCVCVCTHAHIWAHDSFLLPMRLLESHIPGALQVLVHPWLFPFLPLSKTLWQGCLWPPCIQSTAKVSVFILHSWALPLSGTGTLRPQPWVSVEGGNWGLEELFGGLWGRGDAWSHWVGVGLGFWAAWM